MVYHIDTLQLFQSNQGLTNCSNLLFLSRLFVGYEGSVFVKYFAKFETRFLFTNFMVSHFLIFHQIIWSLYYLFSKLSTFRIFCLQAKARWPVLAISLCVPSSRKNRSSWASQPRIELYRYLSAYHYLSSNIAKFKPTEKSHVTSFCLYSQLS